MVSTHVVVGEEDKVFPRGTQSGAYLGEYVETLPWNIFQF